MKTIVNDGIKFVCETEAEKWRARTLLTKEPGTIAWLQHLQSGDVFYDVGANVGCYSLYAARLVGSSGHVYAFEPHPANVASLLRNIEANALTNVTAIAVALGAGNGYSALKLGALFAGSSHTSVVATGALYQLSTSLDWLWQGGHLRLANAIKIDIDGGEPYVIRGMRDLLTGRDDDLIAPPRTIQIESAPETRRDIESLMRQYGYQASGLHYTALGTKQIQRGHDPASVIGNAVFNRIAA